MGKMIVNTDLFANAVGASAEALRRNGEVVCFILQGVETSTALGDFVDIVAHDADCAVDFLY